MIFVSDLDNTLIYSDPQGGVCVEWKDSREMSYMTAKACELVQSLLKQKDFQFIPCTARSRELAMRIGFIQEYSPKFMICDQGGSVYVNGIRDENWDSLVAGLVPSRKLEHLAEKTEKMLRENGISYRGISKSLNLYFVISFHQKEDAETVYPLFKPYFEAEGFRPVLQGRKLYVMPPKLDKSTALEYLGTAYGVREFVTAGDSIFDKKFTALGSQILLPGHATFRHPDAFLMEKKGIHGGEELLELLCRLEHPDSYRKAIRS